jgi:hypothetical protein
MKKTKHEKQGLGKQERKTRKEENKVSDTLRGVQTPWD